MAGIVYPKVLISEALEKYKDLLKTLREKVKTEIETDAQQFNDDLFLLRFCVEHKGDAEKCVNAIKTCIKFRTENKELLAKLAMGDYRHPDEAFMSTMYPFAAHGSCADKSPMYISRSGIGNADLVMKKMTLPQLRNAMIFGNEVGYQICDRLSRENGVIMRAVNIDSLKGASLLDQNKKFLEAMGSYTKESDVIYPTLVGGIIITNCSTSMKAILKLYKFFFPEMLAKSVICPTKSTVTGNITDCPISKRLFDDTTKLPSFLGGKCTCSEKGGCCDGIPNELRTMVKPAESPASPAAAAASPTATAATEKK